MGSGLSIRAGLFMSSGLLSYKKVRQSTELKLESTIRAHSSLP